MDVLYALRQRGTQKGAAHRDFKSPKGGALLYISLNLRYLSTCLDHASAATPDVHAHAD